MLASVDEHPSPSVLWRMQYQQAYCRSTQPQSQREHGVVTLPSLSSSLALGDDALDGVKAAWQLITGADAEAFMRFEAREGADDEDG